MSHTPTPYHVEKEFNVFDANRRSVCTTGGRSGTQNDYEENVANAEFIVAACNEYTRLKAIESILEDFFLIPDIAAQDESEDAYAAFADWIKRAKEAMK